MKERLRPSEVFFRSADGGVLFQNNVQVLFFELHWGEREIDIFSDEFLLFRTKWLTCLRNGGNEFLGDLLGLTILEILCS